MSTFLDFPLLIFVLSCFALWLSSRIGALIRKRWKIGEDDREDVDLVLAGTLTLLSLIIGFSFSMAVSRYDQRKNYEEEEANAIGTEYVRADLLPAANAVKVHALLKSYLDQRLLFYVTRDKQKLRQVDAYTAQLQNELWSAVAAPAVAQPTPVATLILLGMNDVLNSQGYTQAAWRNRIPTAAWMLMAVLAMLCNLLLGMDARRVGTLFVVLPLALSISFFLIADIDSPRRGAIHLRPQNLESLSHSLH